MDGFQKPLKAGKTREVGLAVVSMDTDAYGREFATCNCGWIGYHARLKVLEDRIDAHVERRHQGRAIRL